MMYNLRLVTWIRLFVWLVIGFVMYFTYSRNHSRVQAKRTSNRFCSNSQNPPSRRVFVLVTDAASKHEGIQSS